MKTSGSLVPSTRDGRWSKDFGSAPRTLKPPAMTRTKRLESFHSARLSGSSCTKRRARHGLA